MISLALFGLLLMGSWALALRRWPRARVVLFPVGAMLLVVVLLVGAAALLAVLGVRPLIEMRPAFDPNQVGARLYRPQSLEGQPHQVAEFGGHRYHAMATPRSPSLRRIVTLGESSVHGTHYLAEEAFSAVLQDGLEDTEVINAGLGGALSDEILQAGLEALTWDPDLLILYFGYNDLTHIPYMARFRGYDPKGMALRRQLGQWRLVRVLRDVLPKGLLDAGGSVERPAHLDDEAPSEVDQATMIELAVENATSNMVRLAVAARDEGVPVLVVTQATNGLGCGGHASAAEAIELGCYQRELGTIAQQAARRAAVPLFDADGMVGAAVAAAARPEDREPWGDFFWDGVHPTRLGHALLGEAITPVVTEMLPPRAEPATPEAPPTPAPPLERPPPPCADLFGGEAGLVQRFEYLGPLGDIEILRRNFEWHREKVRVDGQQPYTRLGVEPREPHPDQQMRLNAGLVWSDDADAAAATDALAALVGAIDCGEPREKVEGFEGRVVIRWQEPWVTGVMYPVTGPPGGEITLRNDGAGWILREGTSRFSVSGGEEPTWYAVSGDVDSALTAFLNVAATLATAAVDAPSTECPPTWPADARVKRLTIDSGIDIEATRAGHRFDTTWTGHRFCCIPTPIRWRAELGPATAIVDPAPIQALLAALSRNRSCHEVLPELPMSHAPSPTKVAIELEDGTTLDAAVALNGTRIDSGGTSGVQWTGEASVAMRAVIAAVKEAGPPEGRLWRIVQGSRLELEDAEASSDPAPDLEDWEKELGRQLGYARYCLAEYSRTQEGSLHEAFEVSFTVDGGEARDVAFEAPNDVVHACVVEGVGKGEYGQWADGSRLTQRWQLDVFTAADGAVLPN